MLFTTEPLQTSFFTITAQILARSLANFDGVNKKTDTWIYNLCDAGMSESEQFDSLLS